MDVVPVEVAGRLDETMPDVEVFLPVEVLPVVTCVSLVPGVDLAMVLLCTPDTLDGELVAETLLPEVTLPLWLAPLVVDVLSVAVVFLLTVLLLPMPPLRLLLPVNTRSDPVVPLVPNHLSFGLIP